MQIDDFLSLFKGVKQTGKNQWQAHCPAHRDKLPSLSIKLDGEKILLHCHAGCPTDAVLEAVGLQEKDLFLDSTDKREPFQCVYSYRDEQGELLSQVCRKSPKAFLQRRPNGNGGWIYNLKGVRRVLYRLPELLGSPKEEVIFIPEGEKDVDRLASLGLVATTNPGGAGKWRLEYNEPLKGRKVVILPDHDPEGETAAADHGQEVAESLKDVAASVEIVDLPGLTGKEDVSNWLNKGRTKDELVALIEKAPVFEGRDLSSHAGSDRAPSHLSPGFTAAELMKMELPEPRWIVPGIIPEGLTLLAGKPKVGKSWLCLDLGLGVALGGYALGQLRLDQGPVLYLALEDNTRRLKRRVRAVLQGNPAPHSLQLYTEWPRMGIEDGGLLKLDQWINGHPEIRLVIIDTLARIRGSTNKRNKSAYELDYDALVGLHRLASQHEGLGIVVVHHLRKLDSDDPLDLVSGTTGLTGCADAILVLLRSRGRADAELFITGRDVEEQSLALEWDDSTTQWSLLGDATLYRISQERQAIIEVLARADQPLGPKAIAEALGKNQNTVRQLLFNMAAAEEVYKLDRGLYVVGNVSNFTNQDNLDNLDNFAQKVIGHGFTDNLTKSAASQGSAPKVIEVIGATGGGVR